MKSTSSYNSVTFEVTKRLSKPFSMMMEVGVEYEVEIDKCMRCL